MSTSSTEHRVAGGPDALYQRVLVLAPFGRDTPQICRVLTGAGFPLEQCSDVDQLCREIRGGAAAALVTDEVLSESAQRKVSDTLSDQPSWSDFPLLVLLSGRRRRHDEWEILRGIKGTAHLNELVRPLRTAALLSAVRVALQSRRRQYQVRDELRARERTEQSLRASEERLRLAQQAARMGTFEWKIGTNENRWSAELESLYGLEPGAFGGTYEAWAALVHPEDLSAAEKGIRDGLETGEFAAEWRVVWPDGSVHWLAARGHVFRDDDGRPSRMIGANVDISDRKQVEQALERSHEELERRVVERTAVAERRARDLRRLAAELSEAEQRERKRLAKLLHDDLQQMLVAARYSISDLAQGESDRSRQEVVARVDAMLERCLATSRNLTKELSPPVLQQGTLVDVIEWLGRWFGETHGLSVSFHTPTPIPPAPEHLRLFLFQAVRELLFNVVKHSGNSTARVELSANGQLLKISVEDEGRSFDPKALQRKQQQPEGLGLFNIQERLRALGGHLEYEAGAGGGARFCIHVPLDLAEDPGETDGQATVRDVVPAREHQAKSAKIRILVVDDHQLVREGFIGLLNNQKDLRVVGQAANGREAIEQAESLQPDVIMMDINMPHVDGIEATRRIKERQARIVVIGLSLYEEENIVRAMTDAGAEQFLSKHAPARDVIDAIRASCRGNGDDINSKQP